jgi:hypothetical protein
MIQKLMVSRMISSHTPNMNLVECGELILAFPHAKVLLIVYLDLKMIQDLNAQKLIEIKDYTV